MHQYQNPFLHFQNSVSVFEVLADQKDVLRPKMSFVQISELVGIDQSFKGGHFNAFGEHNRCSILH